MADPYPPPGAGGERETAGPDAPSAFGGIPSSAAQRRATQLLTSLLRPSQADQWRTSGSFWVHTPAGWFRLGTLYDIRYRAPRWPWVERSVCVVTEGFESRPLPDLWAELTVALQGVPHVFTAEANFRDEATARAPSSTDVVELRRWIEKVKASFQGLRRRGCDLDAAYLACDTAHRLRPTRRAAWGRTYAERGAELIYEIADRYPDERARLLAAHEPVFALARSLNG